MLVAAAIGAILGIDIAVRAFDGPSGSNESLAWAVVLIIGAVVVGLLGLRIMRRAKGS